MPFTSLPLHIRAAAAVVLAKRGGVVYATVRAVHLAKPSEPLRIARERRMILNQAQAGAVYSAMLALNNVGSEVACAFVGDANHISTERLVGFQVAKNLFKVQTHTDGSVLIRFYVHENVMLPEKHASQAAFAAAYSLDGATPPKLLLTEEEAKSAHQNMIFFERNGYRDMEQGFDNHWLSRSLDGRIRVTVRSDNTEAAPAEYYAGRAEFSKAYNVGNPPS
jgi:hypothetical protein